VDGVVVQWGPWVLAERAVAALRREAPGVNAVVVDNGTDGLPPDAPEGFRLVSPGRNLGYGAACNLGAREGSRPFLLFLNNDAEVLPGAVEALVAALERNPSAAAAGPRLLGPDGRFVRSIHRAPTPRRVLFEALFLPRLFPGVPFFHGHHTAFVSHRRARDVETLSGAAVLVRRSAFEAVGGFDEDFFFYAEESDLFLRLRARGWRVVFEPAARVVHHGGVSSALLAWTELDRRLDDGLTRYARRHHGARGAAATAFARRLGRGLRAALARVTPGEAGRRRRARYAGTLPPPGG
jgi:GT2 family glycosyltransferase